MELSQARSIAERVVAKLMPSCERIKICGSVRRQKPECRDLDIVVQPKRRPIKNLFGETTGFIACQEFQDQINSWEKLKGEATGKYTQRMFEGVKLELSIADENNFGCLTLIRTGNSDFSHMIMKRVLKCGLEQRDGHLYRDGRLIPIKDEKDYFTILDLPYVEPIYRDEFAFKRMIS